MVFNRFCVDFDAEVDCRSQSLSRTEIKTYAGEKESVRVESENETILILIFIWHKWLS